MINYVYLLYGRKQDCYLEASYSIGTLLKKVEANSCRIIVFTDQPEQIKEWPVICVNIASELTEMQGGTRFIHRTKLCVILRCLERYSGNVLLMDSDTFIRGNIGCLVGQLAPGKAIMDSFENRDPLPKLNGFEAVLTSFPKYHYAKDSWMCNAGVIGIHRQDENLIRRALELCDKILATGFRSHTVEQFSVSEIFRLAPVQVIHSSGTIVHYVKAKYFIRQKIKKVMRQTQKRPWEFDQLIPYWYPYVKFLKLIGQHP